MNSYPPQRGHICHSKDTMPQSLTGEPVDLLGLLKGAWVVGKVLHPSGSIHAPKSAASEKSAQQGGTPESLLPGAGCQVTQLSVESPLPATVGALITLKRDLMNLRSFRSSLGLVGFPYALPEP